MNNNLSGNISRYQAGNITGKAWTRAATPTNATSEYRSTGTYPSDRNAIPEHYFFISNAALGQINPEQQQVNEDQTAKSNKNNDHRTSSPLPETSRENELNPAERSVQFHFAFESPARNSAGSCYSSKIFYSQTVSAGHNFARSYCQEKKKIMRESKLPNE
ncbi:hypothetical protein HHI36_013651 [Cryptolaemus montrouzieri]|uniref:Uncharacterized protein n=1 Tax=Cryptolaemus montrouzieri TaxID=559131 RepID=A0ABD2NIC7_9CUCU